LEVLIHHGEEAPLGTTKPTYGPDWAGIWVPITKGWKELGIPLREFAPGTMASEIGYVPEHGGEFLIFLKLYREIVESDTSTDERIAAIHRLMTEPRFAEIAAALGPYAVDWWAVEALQDSFGLGRSIARALLKAGFTDSERVIAATDEELLKVPRLGRKTLRKIRSGGSGTAPANTPA